MSGQVYQINIKPETMGERGLPKEPVGHALITKSGLRGDFNRYRHEELDDDPDSALLLMPIEVLRTLNGEGWPIRPGDLGENITTSGVEYEQFGPGRVFTVGEAVVQISRSCEPCNNLYLLPYVGEAKGAAFLKVLLHRRGWYARVVKEGEVTTGDSISETSDGPH